MARLLIFSLSLIFFLFSCKQEYLPPEDIGSLSEKERLNLIQHHEFKRRGYYQGSAYKQDSYELLQKLDPKNEFYYRGQSVTHSKIGDYHIAFPLLEKSKELDARENLYYYAWLLIDLYHDYGRALAYLEEFDAYTPDQKDYAWGENVYQLKGLALKGLERYSEAIDAFSQAIESEGDYPDVYSFVYRGICYLETGNYSAASTDFDTAIQDYQQCSMAYFYKGKAAWDINKNAKVARENLAKAKQLLLKGYKKTDPYKEVMDEIHIEMVDDLLNRIP